MGSLISLRPDDLLSRDFRCLYLGWLFSVQNGEFSDEVLEPPVPAGLRELSAPYDSLIEFLGIDEDLVEVAASASGAVKSRAHRARNCTSLDSRPDRKRERWPASKRAIGAQMDDGGLIFCGIFRGTTRHVHHLQLALFNGALLAISSQLPMRVRKRGTGC